MSAVPRLYLDHAFAEGQSLPLTEGQANYLFAVLRLGEGAAVTVFNGRDGAWAAEVAEVRKRGGLLRLVRQTGPQAAPPDLWLLFAPLRKERTAMVVEKAVELGVARLCPVLTAFTQGERLRPDRMEAQVIEAAEQCGATAVPTVAPAQRLDAVLADWPPDRVLHWADESQPQARAPFAPAPAAILIGPEGGFSPAERARLGAHPAVRPLGLGPRVLRAETAALAALVLWQAAVGDWR